MVNAQFSICKDRELIKQFQHQNGDTINQCDDKNSFSCSIPVCVDIQCKQNNISQQRKRADRSDQFIIMKKLIEETTK